MAGRFIDIFIANRGDRGGGGGGGNQGIGGMGLRYRDVGLLAMG